MFKTINWPKYTTSVHGDTKKIKLSDILSYFSILTWLKEGLQPPLDAPLVRSVYRDVKPYSKSRPITLILFIRLYSILKYLHLIFHVRGCP